MRATRLFLSAVTCALLVTMHAARAQGQPDVSDLAIPTAPLGESESPRGVARQEVEVVVRLAGAQLAAAQGRGAKQRGAALSPGQAQQYLRQLEQQQNDLAARVGALGGRETARMSKALNAVAVRIDAAQLDAVRALPNVRSVRPVRNYERSLSETVPYIGATAVQNEGFDGTGIKVAVLDSGIDYTHAFFGGLGTAAAYEAAYGTSTGDARNTTRDGLFPTAKVIGGYDFVGETWPLDPDDPDLDPDPDPIACGPSAIALPC